MSIKRALKFFVGLTILVSGFLLTRFVFAQIEPGLNVVGAEIALPAADPRIVAARIIRVALGFLGILALAIVLYGGFVWMTSAGNPEKIDKAKKILTNGVIGLIIIIFAFGITQYVLNALLGQYAAPGVGAPSSPPVVERLSGALGNGIVESHYPPRGGTGIARNTKIIVTFKEPMLRDSILTNYNNNGTPDNPSDDWGDLNNDNVKIYKSIDGETGALVSNQVKVTFTTDLKTFVFDPVEYLGSPSENIWHTVGLKSGIKKADGSDAFTGAFRDGYLWDFEVSTFVDTTPPQVESTVPGIMDMARFRACVAAGRSRTDCGAWARNVLVQINFDEAMDPTTVSGKTADGFNKIIVSAVLEDGTRIDNVAGTWTIGNQYKTAEFTTDVACGTNSCGGTVYCLPSDADIDVLVKAATLSIEEPPDPEPPEAEMPYDGTTDVVGNSLDGNKDGKAQGSELDDERIVDGTHVPIPDNQGVDHYGVPFATSDTIDLVPPKITDVGPQPGTGNVVFNVPVEMTFSKIMSMSSFNTENIILEDNQRDECAVWFTLGGTNLQNNGDPVTLPEHVAVRTKAKIYHGNFLPSEATATCTDNNPVDQTPAMYYPRATHNVKDLFQNCFFEPVGPGTPPGAWRCVEGEPGCPSPLPWE